MKRVLAPRPSPALVIACIALFASLSGVSYGVATGFVDSREIRDNTVRTQDLRNNEVRGLDIRNSTIRGRDVALDTLTGSDIAESKLGQVPNAARADDAAGLGGAAASSYLRSDTSAFVAVTPATDWEVVPPETPPGYFVDPLGFVHLQGVLRRFTGTTDVALTLPTKARPSAAKRFPVYGEHASLGVVATGVTIKANGDVVVNASSNDVLDNLVSLEGVTFRAGD